VPWAGDEHRALEADLAGQVGHGQAEHAAGGERAALVGTAVADREEPVALAEDPDRPAPDLDDPAGPRLELVGTGDYEAHVVTQGLR
jgi:hypothetical protein